MVLHRRFFVGTGDREIRALPPQQELTMPRFFFHIVDGQFMVDADGVDLPDMAAVRTEAIAAAGAILKDAGQKGWTGDEWQMHVVDDNKTTVLKLAFSATEFP
jgi:hypothetical protein